MKLTNSYKVFLQILNVIVIIIFVNIGYNSFVKSENPDIFIFSYMRFFAIISILLITIYLIISIWNERLIRLNLLIYINITITLALLETSLRITKNYLPNKVLKYLPENVVEKELSRRDILTNENKTSGTNMLFSYVKNNKINNHQWLKFDKNGYRNDKIPEEVDVVLIGDSTLIALEAKKGINSWFNELGLQSYNLGIDSYGPGQYYDVYKYFVADSGLKHKAVVIIVCLANDFHDANNYKRVIEKSGGWREYVGEYGQTSLLPRWLLSFYSLRLITGLIFHGVHYYRYNSIIQNTYVYADYSWGQIKLNKNNFKNIDYSNDVFPKNAKHYLVRLIDLIHESGNAKIILATYPSIEGFVAAQTKIKFNHDIDSQINYIRKIALEKKVHFLDFTASLTEEHKNNIVTVSAYDYHPNSLGTKIMAEEIFSQL